MSAGDLVHLAEARARVGSTLRRKYRLDTLIGWGGMGAVYGATHRNGSRVAVKVLRKDYATDPDLLRRFVREGVLANRIAHPGAVRILDDDVAQDGSPFLVMELLEGVSCRELANAHGGRLDARTTLLIAHHVLDVLVAAHRAGIVHRDIKPNNIFLTSRGARQTARLRDRANASRRRCRERDYASGRAPRHAGVHVARAGARTAGGDRRPRGHLGSGRDGVQPLLVGEEVHLGTSPREIMVYTAMRPARSLGTIDGAPAPLVRVVDRALALSPSERWPSARAMGTAVE